MIKSKIFGLLAAAGVLFATSCVNDTTTDGDFSGDMVTVSFTLSPQQATTGTRAVTYPGEGEFAHISDGSKADVLIYAVYDENGDLLESHGRGVLGTVEGFTAGTGQTVLKVSEFPVTVDFRFVKGKTYKLAFWAQSSQCKAYNTQDLKRVEVIYSELNKASADQNTTTPNNDEYRDAFCKVETIVATADNLQKDILLRRPLAQINVGTAGYDYEIVTRGTNSKKFIYSKIQLGDVARYMDVVNDKVLKSTIYEDYEGADMRPEARTTVDFGYARIPAYVNLAKTDWTSSSFDPSRKKDGEEVLKVDIDKDGQIEDYVGLDDYDEEGDNHTETFKYLSMCYVLVPGDDENSSLLDNVTVWLATDEEGDNATQIVSLTNVPVHRNWRTNIIGQNVLTAEASLTVDVSPIYSGDFNKEDNLAWDGALYDGVFYDAELDEILISNANGLLWLAKMVNGAYKYYVWDAVDYGSEGQQPDSDIASMSSAGYHNTVFSSNGIADPTTQEGTEAEKTACQNLKKRILKATKEKEWPKNNTFLFKGVTVKLTNDIDLAGIDWIPIGFDSRLPIEFGTKIADGNKQYQSAFCGTFDGGDHTIRNITNHDFSSVVHKYYALDANGNSTSGATVNDENRTTNKRERHDNPQWYPVGLFGLVTGDATIRNVRLSNINLRGHHGGGAVAGFAIGDGTITIENCYIDGGSITLTPMFRGDWGTRLSQDANGYYQGRTFARAIHLGGIVGKIEATNTTIQNCDVRNLTLEAYRNVGSLVGTVEITSGNYTNTGNVSVTGNTASEIFVIANKFQVYDYCFNRTDNTKYKSGFGWRVGQDEYANEFVGCSDQSKYKSNTANNVVVSRYASVQLDAAGKKTSTETSVVVRSATIGNTRLEYLPLLSSWFTDEVTLTSNLNGSASTRYKFNDHKFTRKIFQGSATSTKDETFTFPFNLPFDLKPSENASAGRAGMYVESITLDGSGASSGHAVITADGVTGGDDCVMYVAGRNREEFDDKAYAAEVKNLVLRGNPYAYTGILLAPNKHVSGITFSDISVYDVYQTMALDEGADASATTLTVKDANLRGYTNIGDGWQSVTFEKTVFGNGAGTGHGDNEHTCKVGSDIASGVTFKGCWFKAPYVIEIPEGVTVTFEDSKATAASTCSMEITPEEGCRKIVVRDDGYGNVQVDYFSGKE